MAENLIVRPVIRGEGEIRRASSSCCGAKLDVDMSMSNRNDVVPVDDEPWWLCRECKHHCDRIMSEPEKVTFSG